VYTVVGGFTPGNSSFLVMNSDFHFVLAMDRFEVLWSGLEIAMMVALNSKLLKEH
jgi:hypothetical protein